MHPDLFDGETPIMRPVPAEDVEYAKELREAFEKKAECSLTPS